MDGLGGGGARVVEAPWIGRRRPEYTDTAGVSAGTVPCYPHREVQPLLAAGGGGATFRHPFQVVLGATEGTVKVIADAKLYELALTSWSEIAITGLATEFSPGLGEGIFLHGTVEGGGVTGVEIVVADDDGAAIAFDESDPPAQTDFWLALAVVAAAPGAGSTATGFAFGDYWVYQRAFTHYRIENHCADGKPMIYPVPM